MIFKSIDIPFYIFRSQSKNAETSILTKLLKEKESALTQVAVSLEGERTKQKDVVQTKFKGINSKINMLLPCA